MAWPLNLGDPQHLAPKKVGTFHPLPAPSLWWSLPSSLGPAPWACRCHRSNSHLFSVSRGPVPRSQHWWGQGKRDGHCSAKWLLLRASLGNEAQDFELILRTATYASESPHDGRTQQAEGAPSPCPEDAHLSEDVWWSHRGKGGCKNLLSRHRPGGRILKAHSGECTELGTIYA